MYCLLLIISDSALLPLSATGGGRKATNRIMFAHDANTKRADTNVSALNVRK